MRLKLLTLLSLASISLCFSSGCIVPQPRGKGKYERVVEPRTKAVYHRYLPVDYVSNNGRHPNYPAVKRWPVVMTFHGMKPYDNARPQEREWEQEADTYGYIVCAPELATSDSFMEYPLTKEHSYVLRDRKNTIAIMDHLFQTTQGDPDRVLSTSWSCGGYLAHYFPNRFPDRFKCIATRLSNFSAPLMTEETIPAYRDRVSVGIFIGDGDLPACKTESEEAVAWYAARKFRVVHGKVIDRMGHERIPQTAAAFFAEQIGIKPLHPLQAARTIAKVRMTEYFPPQEMIAKMAPKGTTPPQGSRVATARSRPGSRKSTRPQNRKPPAISHKPEVNYVNTGAGREYPFEKPPNYAFAPEKNENSARRGSSTNRPPTAAGATRVASGTPGQENILSPVRSPGNKSSRRTAPVRSGSRPPAQRRVADARTSGRRNSTTNSIPALPNDGQRGTSNRGARRNNRPPRSPSSRDAGSRNNDVRLSDASPGRSSGSSARQSDARSNRRSGSGSSASRPPANGASRRPSAARRSPPKKTVENQTPPAPKRRARRSRQVDIEFAGPTIGTSPLYCAYRVALPEEVVRGADFLWMENGIWIGDEPRGVTILESPGTHYITVLLVTKDNVEYRGRAAVQVLEKGGSSAMNSR